ncbi:DUF1993 domain-containing protein [bacterium]|nr:DUF1993 domain-containing protein [bacterium]
MNISVFEVTVPQFILSLQALKKILSKGQILADQKNMSLQTLFQSRLAPDQFPMGRQVQIACDVAKFCVARLSGQSAPSFEDNETTMEDYLQRIDRTVEYLQQFKPEQFVGYEKRKVTFPWYPNNYLDGHNYLIQHAIPNFYFHITTTYSILRHLGADLGKADYLGNQNWKPDSN